MPEIGNFIIVSVKLFQNFKKKIKNFKFCFQVALNLKQ